MFSQDDEVVMKFDAGRLQLLGLEQMRQVAAQVLAVYRRHVKFRVGKSLELGKVDPISAQGVRGQVLSGPAMNQKVFTSLLHIHTARALRSCVMNAMTVSSRPLTKIAESTARAIPARVEASLLAKE
jgi:hypothetical protein